MRSDPEADVLSACCNTIHKLTNQEKAATLHKFTFTVSNYDYRPLSRHDTQLKNHYTVSIVFLEKPLIKKCLLLSKDSL